MNLKLVIFEDDEEFRKLVLMLVRKRGYQVLEYSEPTLCPLYSNSSCTCPREDPCADILITDNNMPNMTGLEFVRQQSLRGCRGIFKNKAIMSGSWLPEEIELAKSLGCKIFTKPIHFDELINWLDACEATIVFERKL